MDIVKYGPVEPSAFGVTTSAIRGRIAFNIFTCADPAQLQHRSLLKFRHYGDAVAIGLLFEGSSARCVDCLLLEMPFCVSW